MWMRKNEYILMACRQLQVCLTGTHHLGKLPGVPEACSRHDLYRNNAVSTMMSAWSINPSNDDDASIGCHLWVTRTHLPVEELKVPGQEVPGLAPAQRVITKVLLYQRHQPPVLGHTLSSHTAAADLGAAASWW
jgi:hypothetical protein